MLKQTLAAAAAALCLAPVSAFAEGAGRIGFDINGGACDNEIYALFNSEGMVIVNTGSRYMGDGVFYLPSPSSVRQGAGGLIHFDSLSSEGDHPVTWTVRPDGYFTSSQGFNS